MKNIYALLLILVMVIGLSACKKVSENNTSNNNTSCGSITDIDSNVYTSVKIGTQCWMQQNLKTAHYNNRDTITEIEDSATWTNIYNTSATTPAWCYYGENAVNNATYGKLYNWYTVTDARGVCPTGYHLPSDSEWTVLINYLGGSAVCGAMKTINLWTAPNTGATNSSGFTALPGGFRFFDGGFSHLGLNGYFWSSTADGSYDARGCGLDNNSSNCRQDGYGYNNLNGFSVRCVGD